MRVKYSSFLRIMTMGMNSSMFSLLTVDPFLIFFFSVSAFLLLDCLSGLLMFLSISSYTPVCVSVETFCWGSE